MFLLSAHQLVRYLARTDATQDLNRLLSLRVENVSSNRSRNQCFLAFWGNDDSWFIKQSYFPTHYAAFDLSNENRFYCLVEDKGMTGIQDVIPERVAYDERHRILLLKRLDGFTAVPDFLYKVTANQVVGLRLCDFPERAAAVFKRIHLVQATIIEDRRPGPFVEHRPMLLQYQSAFIPQLLVNNPKAHGTFLTMLTKALVHNSGGAVKELDKLNKHWKSNHLIHGDAALRNFMYREIAPGSVELRLVDWELVCWGDPRWDHALFFASYIKSSEAGHIFPGYILDHARRFYDAYYDQTGETDGFEEWYKTLGRGRGGEFKRIPDSFGDWFETVFRLAAVALLHQTIEEFLDLLNQEKREQQSSLARTGQRWLRLLCDPALLFRHPYTDDSSRAHLTPLN